MVLCEVYDGIFGRNCGEELRGKPLEVNKELN